MCWNWFYFNNKKAEDFKDFEIIKNYLENENPDISKRTLSQQASQMDKFLNKMVVGTRVIIKDAPNRNYIIGQIISKTEILPDFEQYFIKKVKWSQDRISMDDLSEDFNNSLGGIMTIMELANDKVAELERVLNKNLNQKQNLSNDNLQTFFGENFKKDVNEKNYENSLSNNFKETDINLTDKAIEQISQKIDFLDPEQMQDLVAGILRAMGYYTFINGTGGPDGGYDILASDDPLMLGNQRIKVEVKHRKNTSMTAKDIRSFMGILNNYEKGLYVSTGGFTSDAKNHDRNSKNPLTLIDKEKLITLIFQYYDNFDSETKKLLPLKKIYIVE